MNPRGRPKLAADEKGNYNPILVGEDVLKTLQNSSEKPEEQAELLAKLKMVKENTEANEYYWKLVFTYSFFVYKNRRMTDALSIGRFQQPTVLQNRGPFKTMLQGMVNALLGVEQHFPTFRLRV